MILAVLAALGTHWTVLQSIAWTGMLADNLSRSSLTDALQKTFDGKHPCCLCRAVAAGKKSDRNREFTARQQKLEFPPASEHPQVIAPPPFRRAPATGLFADSLSSKPPTPPPRARLS
jgi:hypothetical protein